MVDVFRNDELVRILARSLIRAYGISISHDNSSSRSAQITSDQSTSESPQDEDVEEVEDCTGDHGMQSSQDIYQPTGKEDQRVFPSSSQEADELMMNSINSQEEPTLLLQQEQLGDHPCNEAISVRHSVAKQPTYKNIRR